MGFIGGGFFLWGWFCFFFPSFLSFFFSLLVNCIAATKGGFFIYSYFMLTVEKSNINRVWDLVGDVARWGVIFIRVGNFI